MAGQTGTPGDPMAQRSSGTSTGSPSMADRAQDTAGRVVDKVQQTASRLMGQAQETAAPAVEQADDMRGQVMDQATEQVSSRLDMGKDYAVEALTGVAQALRQTGQHLRQEGAQPTLAQYIDSGAERLERFNGHLRQRSTQDLVTEVETYARRNPTTFAAGAFALGLVAARFFRSSGRRPSGSTGMMGGSSQAQAWQGPRAQRFEGARPPSYPSATPTSPSMTASPDRTPPMPGATSPSAGASARDAMTEQLTPIPGSLSAPGGMTGGSGTAAHPEPGSSMGDTPSTADRPGAGGQRGI